MALTVTIELTPSLLHTGRRSTGGSAQARLRNGDIAWLKVRLRQVCRNLGLDDGTWALQIISDEEMLTLHDRFLGIKTTTDVITFDMRPSASPPHSDVLALDTAICVDEAYRQSTARNISIQSELLLYAVHSLLHVSGYDDRTPHQARRMHRREDEILTELGIGPIYQSARRGK